MILTDHFLFVVGQDSAFSLVGKMLLYTITGVARTLKNYTHQRETTVSSNDSLQLHPFSKWELLLKERICSQSKFLPLRYGKSLLGELPWVLLFLLRTCLYCIMGATPMYNGHPDFIVSKFLNDGSKLTRLKLVTIFKHNICYHRSSIWFGLNNDHDMVSFFSIKSIFIYSLICRKWLKHLKYHTENTCTASLFHFSPQ